MFSGICPWSPCDRASPRASVSTLGSMTSRPRAGRGARCGPQAPHLNAAADSTRAGGGKGRLGGATRRSGGSRECASASSPGRRVRTPAPRPAPQLPSRSRAARRQGSGDPAETEPGRADSARAEPPGARIPARSAGGGERCRRGAAVAAAGRRGDSLRPCPARLRRSRVCLPSSPLHPFPLPLPRARSQVRTVKLQPPLPPPFLLPRVPEQPFPAPRVTVLEGRGLRRRREVGRTGRGRWDGGR